MYKFAFACLFMFGVSFAQQPEVPVLTGDEVVLKTIQPMGCGCGKGKGKGTGTGTGQGK